RARPGMVMNRTKAVDTRIQAVSPVSNVDSFSVSVGVVAASAVGACVEVAGWGAWRNKLSDVETGTVAGCSAQATEPPKSAPDKLNASSICFICIPDQVFRELFDTQQTSCQIRQHLHLFHRYGYGSPAPD